MFNAFLKIFDLFDGGKHFGERKPGTPFSGAHDQPQFVEKSL